MSYGEGETIEPLELIILIVLIWSFVIFMWWVF